MLELQEPISGRYRLQQRLCRGGMSDVYLACDELMQREVALHSQELTFNGNNEYTACGVYWGSLLANEWKCIIEEYKSVCLDWKVLH